jgi:hypothetical protein
MHPKRKLNHKNLQFSFYNDFSLLTFLDWNYHRNSNNFLFDFFGVKMVKFNEKINQKFFLHILKNNNVMFVDDSFFEIEFFKNIFMYLI